VEVKQGLRDCRKTILFALSTAPFDFGWYTKAKAIFVPMLVQISLKFFELNCFSLSTVNDLGTPNLRTMFCQKNFLTDSDVIVASGLTLIHLVKYSTETITNSFPPCEGGNGLTRSIPHLCSGQVGGMSCVSAEGLD
jgi:hypothetical protein